jgi:hypothetical protein
MRVTIFSLVVVCLMKILKDTGNYLKSKARLYFLLAIFCFVVFGMLFVSSFHISPLYIDVGDYAVARSIFMVIPLLMGWYWWRQYRSFKKGFEGEKKVTELLRSNLPDDYYLINDVTTKDGHGNIDHVFLSPRKIFVIETKNWKGKLTCYGDQWSTNMGNPSRQARINAVRIRKIIQSLERFKHARIWVEPIVVFANPDVELNLKNITVQVKKLNEILYYLITTKGKRQFSTEELDLIGEEILRQTC